MSFQRIIEDISKSTGLELALVENTTAFSIGDDELHQIIVILQYIEENEIVLITTELGEVPPNGQKLLFQTILEAQNLYQGTNGATLSLDPESHSIYVQLYMSLDYMVHTAPLSVIEGFVETSLKWYKIIDDYRHTIGLESKESEKNGYNSYNFDNRFLKV